MLFASLVWSRDQLECSYSVLGENETNALAKTSMHSLWGYGLTALLAVAAATEFLFCTV